MTSESNGAQVESPRAMRRAALRQLKDTQRLLRRGGAKVSEKARAELQQCKQDLEGALDGKDGATLRKRAEKLHRSTDKHLAMFRKPAWRESFDSVGIAIVVALLLRAFVVEAFKIPSGSMIPTLEIGDQIFVNKFAFGIRIPFTSIRIVDFALPERGDVVVFICPEPPNDDYIKRVIGLPGDEVAVRNGVLFLNGEAQERVPLGRKTHWDRDGMTGRWSPFESLAFRETVGDREHVVLYEANPALSAPDFGPVVVKEGTVLVMGDNRDHSYDSRSWGPVPVSNILGRSMFVWWSWGHKTPDWDRLFTWIE